MQPEVSVILIRENAEQLSGSGCCGKLEGDALRAASDEPFAHTRADQSACGRLHRLLRKNFPDSGTTPRVRVVTVDPRNQLYLAPKLWRDVCRYRPGIREGLKTALQLFALPAVVINGRVVSSRKRPLSPHHVLHEVERHLRPGTHKPSPGTNASS